MANEEHPNNLNLDARLDRLVAASEALLEANRQQGQQQRENYEQAMAQQRENHEQAMAQQRENHEQAMLQQRQRHEEAIARLADLERVVNRQADTALAQQQTIQQLAGVMAEQARALTRAVPEIVAASHRAAQAAETASLLAQSNQNALRDLIDELREGRP